MTKRDNPRDALGALVEWQEHTLNYGKPATARSQPTDDDLCELFNRLDRARKVLTNEAPPVPRAIHRLIYVTGTRLTGYQVKTSGFDGATDIDVPSTRVGNAIVRALRMEAGKRPDLFPPARRLEG